MRQRYLFTAAVGLTAGVAVIAACAGSAHGQPASGVSASEVTIERPPGVLAGTLVLPAATRPPLIILIAGSGPTDRDGNTVGAASGPGSLRQLADSLAVRGIASLRYDKRGLGGSRSSGMPERDLRFETLASDAAAWVSHFKRDERFSSVMVGGHSEGALLGLLALEESPAAGFISIAGAGQRADSILHQQLAQQLPRPLLAQADSTIAALASGQEVDSPPPALAALFRRSVQPYLISWFRHSPRTQLARSSGPCLIIQGTHDLQVPPSEADLLVAARPTCRLVRIDGMNHVLKRTPASRAEQLAFYTDPEPPLAAGLVDAIVSFVQRVPGGR